ncbi:hypothetical protein CEK29_20985 [Bordetella genomosp. 5]|uniref:hypothetical protein n=1 Tax=Bordetella genomosp. 5 TaxID=1395608 RepID=UPI000B9E3016|nr:hypothetical protein [Bordetella genomosp. 5]OZI33340.1 hypothetical protein CEK29_20985 [Bordetella genomosp. 5]
MSLTTLVAAHFWNVACFVLAVAALHGLVAVWVLRARGAALPRWCPRVATGLLLAGAGGLVAGNLLRAQSLSGLQTALVDQVQAICRAADERVTQLGGRGASDDAATRQRIGAAIDAEFRDAVRTHFASARYTPLSVVAPRGADQRHRDLVIRVANRARSTEPMYVGCYNQYAHPPGSIGFGATPYWRIGVSGVPSGGAPSGGAPSGAASSGHVVFFWQERVDGASRVSFQPPAARP